MKNVASIGLDIAKHVFQVHGADKGGNTLFNRKLSRAEVQPFFEKLPPCVVGIEACGTSHHWGRVISRAGHEVRLINPSYVKPFVKREKSDANDAEAINEALTRATMRFVVVKTEEQQALAMLFTTRAMLVRLRIVALNQLKSHLAEFGYVLTPRAKSPNTFSKLMAQKDAKLIHATARFCLDATIAQISELTSRIDALDKAIRSSALSDPDAKRLMTIPGVGPVIATAILAFVPNAKTFKSARHFASWIGLTPRAFSSGGKQVLGSISKRGNKQLRTLLFLGASTVLIRMKGSDGGWIERLRRRRPFKVVATALASKIARTIWALLVKGGTYASSSVATDPVIADT
jgi:transposase